MIKIYKNGNDFIKENKSFLDQNKYMSVFFYLDAKVLEESTLSNYAIKVEEDKKKLLGIKVEPYNLCLYGDKEPLPALLKFLNDNNYDLAGIMCPTDIGDNLLAINNNYYESIGMDFMEASSYIDASSKEVEKAKDSDLDEIYEMTCAFFTDCKLQDIVNKERLLKSLPNFRLIRKNGLIVSMASYSFDTEDSLRITHVYTRPEYRGCGYARMVVNNIKNEILDKGKVATLNVDKKNPISNHIYASLGFKKVFSQGVYLVKSCL